MTYFVRHGKDVYTPGQEGGDLDETGIVQMKDALKTIKAKLAKRVWELLGRKITILHSPTPRAVQSSEILRDGLKEIGCEVENVPDTTLWHENDGHIKRENARQYMREKVAGSATTIIVSHKMVLMVLLKAAWTNWYAQNVPKEFSPPEGVFEHGQVEEDDF